MEGNHEIYLVWGTTTPLYCVTQKLPQIYTENHATFPVQIRKITVQICGNFWVTQYILFHIPMKF